MARRDSEDNKEYKEEDEAEEGVNGAGESTTSKGNNAQVQERLLTITPDNWREEITK